MQNGINNWKLFTIPALGQCWHNPQNPAATTTFGKEVDAFKATMEANVRASLSVIHNEMSDLR